MFRLSLAGLEVDVKGSPRPILCGYYLNSLVVVCDIKQLRNDVSLDARMCYTMFSATADADCISARHYTE